MISVDCPTVLFLLYAHSQDPEANLPKPMPYWMDIPVPENATGVPKQIHGLSCQAVLQEYSWF